MAHNSYPAGTPTGTVPSLYAVPETDWATVILQCYQSINGDAGGTWAPGSFITVGGSGFQLTGTAHSLAAAARLNVESTGEIRLKNGALLLVDGSGSDIRIEVASNIPKITVGTTGAVDIFGALNIKANGLATVEDDGGVTIASGGTVLFQASSILQLDDNSTITANGDINVGSTGVVTFQNSSNIASGATAFAQWSGEWWFANVLKITGACDFIIQGASNEIQYETARDWSAPATHAVVLTYHGSAPDGGSIWTETSDIEDAPCWRTSDETTTGHKSILEFTHLPIGAAIVEVTITTKGTKPTSVLSTRPTYTIVSWSDSSSVAVTAHSSVTTDAHNVATFGTTVVQTTIASTGSPVVVAGRRYGLRITHPYEAVNEQGVRVYECTMTGTVNKVTGQ